MTTPVRTKLVLAAIVVLVFVGSHLAKERIRKVPRDGPGGAGDPQRIISMAPSVTETLFALGLGDRVVGVTRYCNYPPEANRKVRVGGYFDPNFEAVVALKPDLVVMLDDHHQDLPAFRRLGLATLSVCHKNVEGILDSILCIGRFCGAQAEGQRIAAEIEARIERVQRKTAGLPRPRVMVAVERTLGSGKIEDVYIAGADGYFERIIAMAGGRNAYGRSTVRFPVASSEGILQMNPQVIIDLVPRVSTTQLDKQALLADWRQLDQVEAVARARIHVLDEDYVSIPGPRFILLVEKLARLIHPEVDWD